MEDRNQHCVNVSCWWDCTHSNSDDPSLVSWWSTVSETLSQYQPFKPSRCIKASFYIPENTPNFLTTRGFRMKISMKLVYQYTTIFFNFSSTSSHLYPLQVDNCGSNSRLVVDEVDEDYGKIRIERAKQRVVDTVTIFLLLSFLLHTNKPTITQ